MLIKRAILPALLLSLLSVCAQAQVTPEPRTLVPRQPVERDITGGQSHTYELKLVIS